MQQQPAGRMSVSSAFVVASAGAPVMQAETRIHLQRQKWQGTIIQILCMNLRIDARYTVRMRYFYYVSWYGRQEETMSHWFQIRRRNYYCTEISLIKVQNGGNGLGCQPDISILYEAQTVMQVFSRQRSDEFLQNQWQQSDSDSIRMLNQWIGMNTAADSRIQIAGCSSYMATAKSDITLGARRPVRAVLL